MLKLWTHEYRTWKKCVQEPSQKGHIATPYKCLERKVAVKTVSIKLFAVTLGCAVSVAATTERAYAFVAVAPTNQESASNHQWSLTHALRTALSLVYKIIIHELIKRIWRKRQSVPRGSDVALDPPCDHLASIYATSIRNKRRGVIIRTVVTLTL